MSDSDTIEQGHYAGATAAEIRELGDRLADVAARRALLPRHGSITVRESELVLSDWSEDGDLRLARDEVTGTARRLDPAGRRHARPAGARPLVLTTSAGELFLLVDRREFSERTEDEHWRELISGWMAG